MSDASGAKPAEGGGSSAARLVRHLSVSHLLANIGFFMLVQANAGACQTALLAPALYLYRVIRAAPQISPS